MKNSYLLLLACLPLMFGFSSQASLLQSFSTRFRSENIFVDNCFDGTVDYDGPSGWSLDREKSLQPSSDIDADAYRLFIGDSITYVRPFISVSEGWGWGAGNINHTKELITSTTGTLTVILYRSNGEEESTSFTLNDLSDDNTYSWGPFEVRQFPDVVDVELILEQSVRWNPGFEFLGGDQGPCIDSSVFAMCVSNVDCHILAW